jgi:acylaminoacyl-peptidase
MVQEGKAQFKPTPSPEDLAKFYSMSPIAHVDKVKTPMLFMLGSKDRRVPEPDGKRYVDTLRSKGVPVRMLVFPEDTHALDKPQSDFESWVNMAWWLKQYVASAVKEA